ncbi:MAG TPA: HemK2/MTQ2 family protein methyltransferase [Candidatus Thermoplasmatota archaeon]|nr:HemK2/MTQ2 family protein methyltransferase [Candidatus Thermoplasmatota archaeon]
MRPLRTDKEVYEPAEDSALLAQAILERERLPAGAWALDVGTGTGVVARALESLGARVVAVDLNPKATEVARENLDGALVLRGDLATALRGRFEVVAFNAPYLPSGPEERVDGPIDHAFHGGEGGVEVSERFVRDLPRLLAPGGRAYLVVSSRADLPRLEAAVARAGLSREVAARARFFFEEIAVWRLVLA